MTLNTATPAAPFGAFEIFELTNRRASVVSSVRAWNDRRTARNALARLTSFQMDDIGLDGAGPLSTPVHFGRI